MVTSPHCAVQALRPRYPVSNLTSPSLIASLRRPKCFLGLLLLYIGGVDLVPHLKHGLYVPRSSYVDFHTDALTVPLAATVAGGAALAAYLDAKFLVRHDLRSGSLNSNVAKAMKFVEERYLNDKMLVYHIFEDRAKTPAGNNLFLEFEGKSWTYKQFFEELQPAANWLMNDLGIRPGEIVAFDGTNSPDFLKVWFASKQIDV